MHIFSEACVLLIVFTLYWCCGERRRYLKRRIGAHALFNVYQIARNVSFMLTRNDLKIKDDTNILLRGGILFSFHFGIWELMPQTLKKLGFDLGVVVNKYSDNRHFSVAKLFDRLLYRFRSRGGVKVFYRDDTMRMVRFLKRGGVIGILVDGNDFYSKFRKVQKLSSACHVPLVPFAAYRQNGEGILKIGCKLEKILAERPYDYMWFYRSRSTHQHDRV